MQELGSLNLWNPTRAPKHSQWHVETGKYITAIFGLKKDITNSVNHKLGSNSFQVFQIHKLLQK